MRIFWKAIVTTTILVAVLFLTTSLRVEVKAETSKIELSDVVLETLTSDDFVQAYKIVNEKLDVEKTSDAILDQETIKALNQIYARKNRPLLKSSTGLPVSYNRLNSKEKGYAKSSPYQAGIVYNCSTAATSMAGKYWVNGTADFHNGNAYRHALWNGMMSREMDATKAKKWADAHEYGQKGVATQMDLKNNATGRSRYATLKANDGIWWRSPTYQEISNDIMKQVTSGKLVRIVNGKLVKTNSAGKK
ncbi:hypothetical protein HB943_16165 [Listeria weihenstephanensis]|uniref:DUF6973 domain-containing protein n=1 Tax=Listeria weihenstephanensis TaxID=1006155 RepID=A0A841ZAF3_9LIST|nr:hypothetical protein [Listeria weihenstephanensis]MBC1502138.1 hypothetical protein [Listeria weihenstephanensis]